MKKKSVSTFDYTNAVPLSAHTNTVGNVGFYEKSPPKHMETV